MITEHCRNTLHASTCKLNTTTLNTSKHQKHINNLQFVLTVYLHLSEIWMLNIRESQQCVPYTEQKLVCVSS